MGKTAIDLLAIKIYFTQTLQFTSQLHYNEKCHASHELLSIFCVYCMRWPNQISPPFDSLVGSFIFIQSFSFWEEIRIVRIIFFFFNKIK